MSFFYPSPLRLAEISKFPLLKEEPIRQKKINNCSYTVKQQICFYQTDNKIPGSENNDNVLISSITNTPLIPVHHPEHTRVFPSILKSKSQFKLLQIFDKEQEKMGWYTCCEIINRIAKYEVKKKKGTTKFDVNDQRFLDLIHIPTMAMKQGVMDSKAKRGHSTDDLSSLKESMETLKLQNVELYTLVTEKLKEEQEEDDNHEEGDFGFDFEGGSIGF
jgi:hypothetical protein